MNGARRTADAAAAWGVVVAYQAVIFWVSHRAVPDLPHFAHSDKLLHGVAYAVLALCWYAALRCTRPWSDYRRHAWMAAVAAAAYGATDEWHQTFVAGRSGTVDDWVADALGAVVVGVLAACIKRPRIEPPTRPPIPSR